MRICPHHDFDLVGGWQGRYERGPPLSGGDAEGSERGLNRGLGFPERDALCFAFVQLAAKERLKR